MMLKRIKSKDQGLRFDIIDKLLKKRKGHTVKEITTHVNNALEGEGIKVDQRTIYSDLNDLRDKYKLNILKEGSRYKYADPNDGYRKPRAESKDKEMLALGLEAFASLKHLSFFNKFSDVVNRLLAGSLNDGFEDEEKSRIIQIGESYNSSGYQYIEKIYHAIKNKIAIRMLYTNNAGLTNWRIISPYILKEYRNQWYMVAYTTDSSRAPSSRPLATTVACPKTSSAASRMSGPCNRWYTPTRRIRPTCSGTCAANGSCAHRRAALGTTVPSNPGSRRAISCRPHEIATPTSLRARTRMAHQASPPLAHHLQAHLLPHVSRACLLRQPAHLRVAIGTPWVPLAGGRTASAVLARSCNNSAGLWTASARTAAATLCMALCCHRGST
jgi:DNA-binding transcriptional ArsR family regulator